VAEQNSIPNRSSLVIVQSNEKRVKRIDVFQKDVSGFHREVGIWMGVMTILQEGKITCS
jgi:hypothetical protein